MTFWFINELPTTEPRQLFLVGLFFLAEFYDFTNANTTCTQSVCSSPSRRSLALGLVTDGQLAALPTWLCDSLRRRVSNLSTVTCVAHQQHLELLGGVDRELPKATGQHCAAPITDVGHQDLALNLLHTLLSAPLDRLTSVFDWC